MAEQAFSKLQERTAEEASSANLEKPGIQDMKRLVFTDLMEFLLVSWLHGQLMGMEKEV